MANSDDVAYHFAEDWSGKKIPPKHPKTVFFHLFFRASAILVYIFCGLFTDSFISCFVSILLLLCLDFWTVKNVTGRLLVGLRWWNYIDDEGKSHWVYESRQGEEADLVNPAESQVFWFALIICPIIWFMLLFVSIFGLKAKWFVVVCVALVLNGANLYGYVRCKVNSREKFTVIISSMMGKQVITNMFSSLFKKQPEQPPPSAPFSNVV